jgi:hypothetical protein
VLFLLARDRFAYIESLHAQRPELTLTVIVPQLVFRHWWQRALHADTAIMLRRALESRWRTSSSPAFRSTVR